MRRFSSRSEFAFRFGIYGASMLRLGSLYGGPLPQETKVACRIGGNVCEARFGETSHAEIEHRELIPGLTSEAGYTHL